MAGRPPKSTAQHVLENTYRADRHGDRSDADFCGEPERPRGLDKHGEWIWNFIVASTPSGVLARIDTIALTGLCRWWSVWCNAMDEHEADGTWKAACRAAMAWKHVERLLSKYGCSPTERAKLKVPNQGVDEEDPLIEILRGTMN